MGDPSAEYCLRPRRSSPLDSTFTGRDSRLMLPRAPFERDRWRDSRSRHHPAFGSPRLVAVVHDHVRLVPGGSHDWTTWADMRYLVVRVDTHRRENVPEIVRNGDVVSGAAAQGRAGRNGRSRCVDHEDIE